MSKPLGIFLIGGPGSGKDYVLNNIFARFDLTEVQVDHIINGAANELLEQNKNIVINGALDEERIKIAACLLENYNIDYVYVSVTNKVSRLRNSLRENPIAENKRIDKFIKAEKLAESIECFKFNNSINLNESSDFEKVFFADQIEKLLSRLLEHGLEMQEVSEAKTFAPVAKHKSGLPKKYVSGLSDKTAAARKAHWKKMGKLSDRDPRAYKPAPGDATAKTKLSQYTKKYRAMYGEQVEADVKKPHTIENIAKKHKVDVSVIEKALEIGKKVEREHTNDESTAEIIALAHLWERPDYYKMLAKMEQKVPVTPADHVEAERKDQIRRDRRDWRILHHQNRHIHQAAKASMSEAEEKPLPVKLRRAPRSGNITAVMDKRKETGRVDEGAADKSLAAKAEKSGVPLRTLKAVYRRGVAAWNSGHRPGTTPQQWGHARVNSYITKGKTYHTADKDLRREGVEYVEEDRAWTHEDEYGMHMDAHADAMAAGKYEKAEKHAKKAEAAAAKHFKATGEKIKDAGYIGNSEHIIKEEVDINAIFEMQLVGTDEYRKHAIAMTPGQGEPVDAFPVKSPNTKTIAVPAKKGKSIVSQYTEHTNCGTPDCCGECSSAKLDDGRTSVSEFTEEKEKDGKEDGVDFTPTANVKKLKKGDRTPGNMRFAYLDGLPVVTARVNEAGDQSKSGKTLSLIRKSMPVPRQVPAPPGGHPVPPGYKRVKDHIAGWKLVKEENTPELTLEEAVQYHLENKVSFTENVFRPGSDMFFQMIDEAKKLYSEGKYTPADEYEIDMLNSNIGEVAEYEGQLVVLDYPIEEGLEEACWSGYTQKGLKKKGSRMVPNCVPVSETEEINEVLDAVYPHKYHGTLDDDVLPDHYGPEHHYTFQVPEKGNPELRHTYSVSISREGKTGHLAFGYHGKQPENYTPITGDDVDYLKMAKPGIHKITGEGGGKASSILSTVAAIARKHAKKHGLTKIKFAGDSSEPSRTGLYARIANRFGGKQLKRGGTASSHVYSVPIKEEDETGGKGIGKPWREGGGGAVYVRDGGSIRKIRFSQSGMKKKFMDPAATRSFVARHHCLTNKDKTSASYWACRYPRFFSNSGKIWW